MRLQATATILIVDDDPAVRVFLELAVREHGFQPVLAASLSEALGILRGSRVELVICDRCLIDPERFTSSQAHGFQGPVMSLPRPFSYQEFQRLLLSACGRAPSDSDVHEVGSNS